MQTGEEGPSRPLDQVALTLALCGADLGPGRQAHVHRKVMVSSTE